ncbi:hypothetical protein [Halioglobus sp. Uisw_031]|uniref:hypothetical protein n=1 Tax=Halioglobus sp. Uisw_031 TaxID=3230977 RepID=UPI0039EB99B3
MPVFLALCLLSMQMDIDVLSAATMWFALRVVYLPLYKVGVAYLPSGVWIGSGVCMVSMAIQVAETG